MADEAQAPPAEGAPPANISELIMECTPWD